MNTHGWKKVSTLFASVVLTTMLSGCQTLRDGAHHPFLTMFENQAPKHRLQLTSYETTLTPAACQESVCQKDVCLSEPAAMR